MAEVSMSRLNVGGGDRQVQMQFVDKVPRKKSRKEEIFGETVYPNTYSTQLK
jgi:hypothetical protein